MRSRTRAKSVGLDDVDAEASKASFASPEAEHADRELQTLIRQAVARLGKTAGEMFVLRYYEGYDNQEIAKLLDTSQMVVGVVLHRARTRLEKRLGTIWRNIMKSNNDFDAILDKATAEIRNETDRSGGG